LQKLQRLEGIDKEGLQSLITFIKAIIIWIIMTSKIYFPYKNLALLKTIRIFRGAHIIFLVIILFFLQVLHLWRAIKKILLILF
jgi:hypothetical protein